MVGHFPIPNCLGLKRKITPWMEEMKLLRTLEKSGKKGGRRKRSAEGEGRRC